MKERKEFTRKLRAGAKKRTVKLKLERGKKGRMVEKDQEQRAKMCLEWKILGRNNKKRENRKKCVKKKM